MTLRLHNTLTRRVDTFVPQDPQRVTMYLCGPTVYNYVHIGNARGPVVFGLLVRLLKRQFGADHVVFARNITDVDDKINTAAAELNVPIEKITAQYAAAYADDMRKLGVDAPDLIPYATQHITQIIAMCQRLIDNGNAYAAEGHVLFDVTSYPSYGHLSGRSADEMIAGARVEIAPYKKNPADFVLWKPSTPDLPGWESPWGRGRPGWHIECSAMCEAHLGETIDIHAGGNDLMFPHHENEVAQSECAHGQKVFARYWLHNGMLTFGGKKMSKSVGNTLVLHELLERYPAELLRYMLMKAHYRQPLDWSDETLQQAKSTLDGWYGVLRDLSDVDAGESPAVDDELIAALSDDLNTPEALAVVSRWAANARKAISRDEKIAAKKALLGAGDFLGLLRQNPEDWFKHNSDADAVDPAWVEKMLIERADARKARDFAKADRIRDELAAKNVVIEDGPQGARWKIVTGSGNEHRPDVPMTESANEAQDAIVDEFSFFGDWTERYQYLIDLGRKLPPFPEELKREDNKVHGCQSQVWLVPSGDANRMEFRAISDSAIVSGLIALLLRVYSGRSAQEILDTPPRFVESIGLAQHLSPTRNNGLAAMFKTIQEYARQKS